MKRAAALLTAPLAMAIAGSVGREAVRHFLRTEPDPTSLEVLLAVASELNKNMPIMVDTETELMTVSAEERTVIYNYRMVNLLAAEMSVAEFREALRPGIIAGACSTPQTRDDFLRQGITMRYVYYDRTKTHLASLEVLPSDCGDGR